MAKGTCCGLKNLSLGNCIHRILKTIFKNNGPSISLYWIWPVWAAEPTEQSQADETKEQRVNLDQRQGKHILVTPC
jgi:hypothetical protein